MSYRWALGAGDASAVDAGVTAGRACLENVAADAEVSQGEFEDCAKAAAYAGAAAYCTAQAGPIAGELCGEAAEYLAGKVAGPVYKAGRAVYEKIGDVAGDLFGGSDGCPTKLNGKCWPGAFSPAQQADECLRLRKSNQTGYKLLGCANVLQTWDAQYGAHVEATAKSADAAYRLLLEDFSRRYNESVLPLQREVAAVATRLGQKVDLGLMGTTPMNAGMAEVLGRDLVNYATRRDPKTFCAVTHVLGGASGAIGPCPVFSKTDLVKRAGVDWFAAPVKITTPSFALRGLGSGIDARITSSSVVPKTVAWNADLNPSMFRMDPGAQGLVVSWARGIELANVELNAFLLDLVTKRAATLELWEGKWDAKQDAERRRTLGTWLLVLGGAVVVGGAGYVAWRKH